MYETRARTVNKLSMCPLVPLYPGSATFTSIFTSAFLSLLRLDAYFSVKTKNSRIRVAYTDHIMARSDKGKRRPDCHRR